jgi:hypothetical protein
MVATLFSVLVTIVIIGFLWFYIARPILEDYGVLAPRSVNGFQEAVSVMSRENDQTEADEQTDRQTDLVSVADQWLDRLEVDRTREAVVDLLVYSGWSVSDFRKVGVLRGDNGTMGAEVEAARKRLGISIEPRQLRVRDAEGERLIPMDVS